MRYTGKYINGIGEASQHVEEYDEFFNCRMVGTFNIELDSRFTDEHTSETPGRRQWFMSLKNECGEQVYCWGTKAKASNQINKRREVITKTPIPDSFKTGVIEVECLERWGEDKAAAWATDKYWFQTWPWTPQKKADSRYQWDVIRECADWSGATVLDIGGNTGFHAFCASESGARATVFEPNESARKKGVTIARHIEQQDVQFVREDPGGEWDVILYLSVHHQIDPTYEHLPNVLAELRERAPVVIVELHVEPLDGDMPVAPQWSKAEIDGMFARKLVEYSSTVRGTRAIYVL